MQCWPPQPHSRPPCNHWNRCATASGWHVVTAKSRPLASTHILWSSLYSRKDWETVGEVPGEAGGHPGTHMGTGDTQRLGDASVGVTTEKEGTGGTRTHVWQLLRLLCLQRLRQGCNWEGENGDKNHRSPCHRRAQGVPELLPYIVPAMTPWHCHGDTDIC